MMIPEPVNKPKKRRMMIHLETQKIKKILREIGEEKEKKFLINDALVRFPDFNQPPKKD